MNTRRTGQIRYRRKPAALRRKTTGKGTVATRAGQAVREFLRSHPEAARLSVELKGGKIAVSISRGSRKLRVAPPGLFDAIYTRRFVAEDNALAATSVIDRADFDA